MSIQKFVRACAAGAVALLLGGSAWAQSVTQLHVATPCAQSTAVDVSIDLASSSLSVAGGQFFLSYDTARLQYLGVTVGPSFPTLVHHSFDNIGGTIDCAMSTAFGAPMVSAPTLCATLHFTALTEVCASESLTLVSFRARPLPLPPTRYTDTDGNPIATTAADLAPFTVDHTNPTIATNPPASASANAGCVASVTLTPPLANDNCGPVTVVGTRSDSQPLASPYPLGPTIVTWTATDCAGNSAQSFQTVTVTDNTPPSISVCGVDQNAPGNFSCQAPVPDFTAAVVASDNCTSPGSLVITQSPLVGTLVGPAPTTVTISVSDAANNVATCQRMFTIDPVPPPTASAMATGGSDIICSTGVVALDGTATNFASVQWSGGSGTFTNPLALDTVYTPHPNDAINSPITLTLQVNSAYSCVPPAFAQVVVTVNSPPVAPTSATVDSPAFCVGAVGTIKLTAIGGSGIEVKWYRDACGTGFFEGSGNPLVIPAPTASHTYYARWFNKCGSSTCADVAVTVYPTPVAPTGITTTDDNYCFASVPSITLTAVGGSGSSVDWYSGPGPCGDTFVSSGVSIVVTPPVGATTYYARWNSGTCTPSACAMRTITVLPTTGACCNAYGNLKTCTVVAPIDCAGPTTPTHVYRGDCTTCGPLVCCPADYNNNGVLEVADIFAFLDDWFAGTITSDFNNSGTLQVQDVFDFLSAWFAGC